MIKKLKTTSLVVVLLAFAYVGVLFAITGGNHSAFASSEGLVVAQADGAVTKTFETNIDIAEEVKSDSDSVVYYEDTTPPAENVESVNLLVNERARSVQTVLAPLQNAVISAPIDGLLKSLPFQSGDSFKKGDVLAEYQCNFERAKVAESVARKRISDRQLKAFNRLKKLDSVSDVELVSARESNKQEIAVLAQAQARLSLCKIVAPFDGRIQKRSANNYEATRSGRVLMEISSAEPLQAELLVPSTWLRWLNVGTELSIYVVESDQRYPAKITRIHGEVDPITQSVHVVAQLNEYQVELLPGMSGTASFRSKVSQNNNGFMGLNVRN